MPKINTARTNDETRDLILRYFYNRNKNANSRRVKRNGAATTIKAFKADLKEMHGLTVQDVQSNLTYLLDQEWVKTDVVEKQFQTKNGMTIPSKTEYYLITAAGIDKIEGPGEFTNDRFAGINIDLTGQNIVNIGNGNVVDARFENAGQALSNLRDAVTQSDELDDSDKLNITSDIASLQVQLAKSQPNVSVVAALWDSIQKASSVAGLVSAATQAAPYVLGIIG